MSTVYPLAKQGMETAQIDIINRPVRVVICSASYVYNAAHQFRSSVTGILATSAVLTGKSNANGVFRADNVNLPSVPTGNLIASVIGYIDTGAQATDILLWVSDGLAVPTNGADVNLIWDTGQFGIFAL